MCGRYVLLITAKTLAANYGLSDVSQLKPRYNIAPGQEVAVVRNNQENGARELAFLKWGLVPFWAKDKKIGYKTINARSETAAKSPAYRAAFKYRRCLIPADGFYEWLKKEKEKQPYLFHMADWSNFAFAGLWEHWEGKDGEVIESCSILTTEANDLIKDFHDRMPVILDPDHYASWLESEKTVVKEAQKLLKPHPGPFEARPVSKSVNSPSNDHPSLIEPVNG